MKDKLLGALVGLARAMDESNMGAAPLAAMVQGLTALDSGTGLEEALDTLRRAKHAAVPDCAVCQNPCGRTADLDVQELESLPPELRDAKQALLSAAIRYARQCEHPSLPLLTQALFAVGYAWFTQEEIEEQIKFIEEGIVS